MKIPSCPLRPRHVNWHLVIRARVKRANWTTPAAPVLAFLLAALLLPPGCGRGPSHEAGSAATHGTPARPPLPPEGNGFVDVTRAAGIDFVHSFGDGSFSNLIEAVGSGAAWLDFDQDGLLDLYLATGKHHPAVSKGERPPGDPLNRLYRNRGQGAFQDVTLEARVGCAGSFSMGVASADYDDDGFPDIYVANYGPNVLLHNRGNGSFEDATSRAGVGDPGASVAAVWLDYDRDGHLDLYVGNYIRFDPRYNLFYAPDGFPGPLSYAAELDRLYRNRGDGTFEDVTAAAGIDKAGRAMSVAAADFDDDGFDDIYVSNDAMENFLYRNVGGKRFSEVAGSMGVAYNSAGDSTSHMAVDFGDYDGDGRLDIFVSDSSISSLFHNRGKEGFLDQAVDAGVGRQSAQFVGWGSFFFDMDGDGDLDIFKVNGDLSRLFGQEPQVFENLGGGTFRDASGEKGEFFRKEWLARGAACGDYDSDGDLDVIVVNLNGPAVLLRNDGVHGSWIEVLLRGAMGRARPGGGAPARLSNRDGLGAKVLVTAGGKTQTAERRSSGGYLSQNDPRMHFGLGKAEKVDRLEVRWPSGRVQVLEGVPARQVLTVEEPNG